MIRKYLTALALFAGFLAPACAQDSWTGEDKKTHFAVSLAFGFVGGRAYPDEPLKGFAVGIAPGVIKEILDSRPGGSGFSMKDLAWDALGAALGSQFGGWTVRKYGIAYQTSF